VRRNKKGICDFSQTPRFSSGLDESLGIILRIDGADVANAVQTAMPYSPQPPVQAREPGFTECPLKSLLHGYG
jgi:hypothetical protein